MTRNSATAAIMLPVTRSVWARLLDWLSVRLEEQRTLSMYSQRKDWSQLERIDESA
jgi:hypothetical protein